MKVNNRCTVSRQPGRQKLAKERVKERMQREAKEILGKHEGCDPASAAVLLESADFGAGKTAAELIVRMVALTGRTWP